MQLRKPDTSLIKIAKMAETNPVLYQQASKISDQIQQTNIQAITFASTPTKNMPEPVQKALKQEESKVSNIKKPILIDRLLELLLWFCLYLILLERRTKKIDSLQKFS